MLTPRLRFTTQERRDSFDRHNSHDRRNSNDPDGGDSPMKKLDVEMLEVQQKQRRSSMQMRRTSLAEVIPDWPLLQKAKVAEKVHVGGRSGDCGVSRLVYHSIVSFHFWRYAAKLARKLESCGLCLRGCVRRLVTWVHAAEQASMYVEHCAACERWFWVSGRFDICSWHVVIDRGPASTCLYLVPRSLV